MAPYSECIWFYYIGPYMDKNNFKTTSEIICIFQVSGWERSDQSVFLGGSFGVSSTESGMVRAYEFCTLLSLNLGPPFANKLYSSLLWLSKSWGEAPVKQSSSARAAGGGFSRKSLLSARANSALSLQNVILSLSWAVWSLLCHVNICAQIHYQQSWNCGLGKIKGTLVLAHERVNKK